MSALTDSLKEKNREFLLNCKVTITVDSLDDVEAVTYAVQLDAPSFSETLLNDQTAVEAIAAFTEFTDFIAGKW